MSKEKKYCDCENSLIKNGVCTTCGLLYDFALTEEERDLKEEIKFLLGMSEDEFNNTPAEKIYAALIEKSSFIKSN